MKLNSKLVMAALVGFSGLAAEFVSAKGKQKELELKLACRGVENVPDNSIMANVYMAPFADRQEIEVVRSLFTGAQSKRYPTQTKRSAMIGAKTIYQGDGVSFAISYTSSPNQDGTRSAMVTIIEDVTPVTYELVCKVL